MNDYVFIDTTIKGLYINEVAEVINMNSGEGQILVELGDKTQWLLNNGHYRLVTQVSVTNKKYKHFPKGLKLFSLGRVNEAGFEYVVTREGRKALVPPEILDCVN